MKQVRGISIVQLMVVLLIVGIVVRFVADFIMEKRCEANQASMLCEERKAAAAE